MTEQHKESDRFAMTDYVIQEPYVIGDRLQWFEGAYWNLQSKLWNAYRDSYWQRYWYRKHIEELEAKLRARA